MKAIIKNFILLIVLSSVSLMAPQKAVAQVSVNFQIFYDDLSPYGNWVNNSDYGYVWIPNVPRGFTPYGTNGYWVFTDAGWTWASNYSWGWAPFHYGRWFYDSYYGWLWVPDNEWGPGWVSWRRSDDYYGWAPIGPGISIDIAYSSGYSLPYNQWRFVRNRDFGRTNINNYYINSSNNTTIIRNSTVINNIHADRPRNVRYNGGPDRTEVEKRVGKKFTPVVVGDRNKPGQNMGKGELQLYRPQVEKNNTTGANPAPSKVGGWKGVKPESPKNAVTGSPKENQPAPQQPAQPKRNDQPVPQQPTRQKRNDQPAPQQPAQPKRNDRPVPQQPTRQKRNDQPAKQQPAPQPHNDQPARQQPVPQRHNDQPAKQQSGPPPQNNQPKKISNRNTLAALISISLA